MSVEDVLSRILGALVASDVPYMLTGSLASSYHGVPRSTHDVDIVIDPTEEQLRAFLALLPDDAYYKSESAATEAFRRRSQFNVVDFATGWKVGLIFCKRRAFSRMEFGRRRTVVALGLALSMAAPEDVLLAKLEWSALSGSERQVEYAAGILREQGTVLDRGYIEQWVSALGLQQQWRDTQRRAAGSSPAP